MVTWYILCDPTLKGELLVQWRNQWKQWGTTFRYWNGESLMRKKYGFGQWGYVKTDKDMIKHDGIHVMGWEWKEIWGSPTMWKEIKNGPRDTKNLYAVRDWYIPLMIRWRIGMCLFFNEMRMTHGKMCKWEKIKKWQPYTNA